MSTNNSLSQLLEQFLELNTNSLETFERINEAIASDKENVVINLFDNKTGAYKNIQIPSFGYLKRELQRLDQNMRLISNVDSNGSNVRLKDGTFRRVHVSKLKSPAKSIQRLDAPTQFNTRLNEFFEDFLNPILTVNLDVTNQIPVETEEVYIERYVFDSNSISTVENFDELYNTRNDIDYKLFISQLSDLGLQHYIDAEIVRMPVRKMQYKGNFDVLRISDEQKTIIVDGVQQTQTVRLYTLNKITYSDSDKGMLDTETLKIGDSLIVNSGNYNTRYNITNIRSETSQIELQLIEGFETIKIDSNQLSIYKGVENQVEIEVKIGFNERQVVFVKPIDPNSRLMADNWSPGIGFYSNNLTIDDGGIIKNLGEYYAQEVADFGEFIKSLKVDYIPPSSVGLTPDPPSLDSNNFKVVQINRHLTDNATTQRIKKLEEDKKTVEANIKQIDSNIKVLQNAINTRRADSIDETNRLVNELKSLQNRRKSENELFVSIVNELEAISRSANTAVDDPKYRVRGFWSVPSPKRRGNQESQEIVQFKLQYRYISTSGSAVNPNPLPYDNGTAYFSSWNEVNGPVRERKMDEVGVFKWVNTDTESDSEVVNFNSLDIPITPGEKVEFRIKSISEAGFPSNPIISDWSNAITIEFPDDEFDTNPLSSVITRNELDRIKSEINIELDTTGIIGHSDDSFQSGTREFKHKAENIASGFFTEGAIQISLFDKIKELQSEIESLKAKLQSEIGELIVHIIDPDGIVIRVNNNEKKLLFAGYYIENLPESNYKGHIVTKNFKIELSNSKATQLELISRLVGDTTLPAYSSSASISFGMNENQIDPFVIDNTYYTTVEKYDMVPLIYQNLTNVELSKGWLSSAPNQSMQQRGQFIYSRFKNLAADQDLYYQSLTKPALPTDTVNRDGRYDWFEYGLNYKVALGTQVDEYLDLGGISTSTWTSTSSTDAFIWNGTANSITLSDISAVSSIYNQSILIHEDHPYLSNSTFSVSDMVRSGDFSFPLTMSLQANQTNGKKQLAYRKIETQILPDGTLGNRKSAKQSFVDDDQYLLGGRSCGSFLYLAPIDTSYLVVDAPNRFGKKRIQNGASNSIIIDMIFQYRMTDYFGKGSTGTGKIGGQYTSPINNLTYSKIIGIDIIDSNNKSFQFDIEIFARYKPDGQTINSIGGLTIDNYKPLGGYQNNPG